MNNAHNWWATYNAALTGMLARGSSGVELLRESASKYADDAHGKLDDTVNITAITPHGYVQLCGPERAVTFAAHAFQAGQPMALQFEVEQKASREKMT